MKCFNTQATCIPNRHYMIDISDRVEYIAKELIAKNKYFTINRARQFGKTTLLSQLKAGLKDTYHVIRLSFEGISLLDMQESRFINLFVKNVARQLSPVSAGRSLLDAWEAPFSLEASLSDLDERITALCANSDRELILFVDEVDDLSNHALFQSFLGMLRRKYIDALEGEDYTFKSVILTGVYDIKNISRKMQTGREQHFNSPWNIAVDFKVDMSFGTGEIARMLEEYCADHCLSFDIQWFAQQIEDYTSGYPFLVSRICELLDTEVWKEEEFQTLESAWTPNGFQRTIKLLLNEHNTLFDDLNKKLHENSDLKALVERIVIHRARIPFNVHDDLVQLGQMFGWFKASGWNIAISNRIFEIIICDKLIQERRTTDIYDASDHEMHQLKTATELKMDLILSRFCEHFQTLYAAQTRQFLESEARLLFLTFLKPIINGSGNYYIEAEGFDKSRTDVVVDYCGRQYVIELKIWHGDVYEKAGVEQLAGYLERMHLKKGWLLSFCFLKDKKARIGQTTLIKNGITIVETVV